jgi:hypothetical protein
VPSAGARSYAGLHTPPPARPIAQNFSKLHTFQAISRSRGWMLIRTEQGGQGWERIAWTGGIMLCAHQSPAFASTAASIRGAWCFARRDGVDCYHISSYVHLPMVLRAVKVGKPGAWRVLIAFTFFCVLCALSRRIMSASAGSCANAFRWCIGLAWRPNLFFQFEFMVFAAFSWGFAR